MVYKSHAEERATRGFGFLEVFLAKKRAAKANSLITSSSKKNKILDVGCGSFPYFLKSSDFSQKYGVDSSIKPEIFKDTDLFTSKIDIETEKLPYPNNSFDVVTMLAVFEHISKDKLPFVLGEINRVLRKNGIIIVTTPSPWSSLPLFALSRIGLVSKVEIDDHKHSISSYNIKNILKKAGFQKIKYGFFEFYFNMWFVGNK